MSYRIGLVTAKNFGPFRSMEFDFGKPGLTVIEGVMVDRPGCSSNGSGKSYILEAPVWGLTGRLIRDGVSVDSVVHGYLSDAEVTVQVVGGPETIEIRRYRKHSEHRHGVRLFIGGKDGSRGTNQETDRAIENELGLDFTTFMNTVAFGARSDTRSFFTASDGDRKSIMRRLLGLDLYEHAQKLARAKLRETATAVETIMEREITLASLSMEQDTALERLGVSGDDDERELEYETAAAQVNILRGSCHRQDRRTEQANADLEAEIENHRQQTAEYRRTLDAIAKTKSEIERAIREVTRESGAADSQIARFEDQIARLRSLVGGKCPTCQQTLTATGAETAVVELQSEAEKAAEKASAATQRLRQLRAELDEIESAPEEPSRWAVETVEEELRIERERSIRMQSKLDAAIIRRDEAKKRKDQKSGTVSEVRKRIREIQTEQDDLAQKKSDLQARADRLDFWVRGFGNEGVPSFLIEAELPEINQTATSFAVRLLGGGTSVCLLPTKQLKTKDESREQMVVEATIPGCAQNYADASKGQRHRLDLSLILALREVVARRSTAAFDQLFCDELFDGVDGAGIECVVEILRELAVDRPVVLVTHDSRLKSIGDRTVTVTHEGGVASL